MSRKKQYAAFVKFLVVFAFAALYAIGGAESFGGMKWIRRFLAPGLLCGAMFSYTRDWRALVQMPLMMASLSLGYGADELMGKLIRRGIYGAANGCSSSASLMRRDKWTLAVGHILNVMITVIALGVFNQMTDPRVEEFTIGATIALFPVMGAQKRTA